MQPSLEKPPKHSPAVFYLRLLLYMYIALILRVIAFAPLLCFFLFPAGSSLRWCTLLCPVMILCFLFPLRFSFAQAITRKEPTRYFSFDTALSMSRYGEKLGESVLYLLSVAKWGIPLVAILGYGYYYYTNIDALTLLSSITTLGETAVRIYATIVGIFGSEAAMLMEGGFAEGLYVIAAVFGLAVLVLIIGIMRNSAFRYIWAVATQENHNPRSEQRRKLKGFRFFQLLIALANLLLLTPFFYVVINTFSSVLGSLSFDALMTMSGDFVSPKQLTASIAPFLFAFFCLYFTLLPLRRMMTAWFSDRPISASSKRTKKRESRATGNSGPVYPSIEIPSHQDPASAESEQNDTVSPPFS